MTQYSKDGIVWGFPTNAKFDGDLIAKRLRINPGDFIYYREHEGDVVKKLKWGRSNERPTRPS